jgi:hypothetical protein
MYTDSQKRFNGHRLLNLLIILTAVGLFAPSAYPAVQRIQKPAAAKFCEDLMWHFGSSLSELERLGFLIPAEPGIFQFGRQFSLTSPITDVEIRTLQEFLRYMPGQAQHIGTFGPNSGVPVVDAVYFPQLGQPINLMIKDTNIGDTTNGNNKIVRYILSVFENLSEGLYSAEYIAKQYRVQIIDGKFKAEKGTSDQKYREYMVKALTATLGLPFNGEQPRPLALLIDRRLITKQHYTIYTDRETKLVTLRIVDDRVKENELLYPVSVNLTHLQRKMGEDARFKGFYVLFKDEMLIVERDRIELMKEHKP